MEPKLFVIFVEAIIFGSLQIIAIPADENHVTFWQTSEVGNKIVSSAKYRVSHK